jgi:hypothetical protein
MGKNGKAKSVQVLQADEQMQAATPRSRLRLGTVRECRRELARLYIEARTGVLEASTATRLAYMLTSLSNMIRDTELEKRIAMLEMEDSGNVDR